MIVWTWKADSDVRADVAILQALEQSQGDWEGGDPLPVSRSQLKRLMEEGRITLEGSPLKANAKLPQGARVRVEFPPPKPSGVLPEDRPIDILFQDEHLLVLNKPPGLTVHPSETQSEGTLVNALLHHVKDLSGIGGVLRPGIVHRIDKDTSGALVITKTDAAHRALVEVFSRHEIDRVYWALCYGSPPQPNAEHRTRIASTIGRNPKDRKRMAMNVKEGRDAVTYFRRIEEYGVANAKPFASWLEVTLETGRTHQIRVHLTGQGFSILADPVYGNPSEKQPKWLNLPRDVRDAASAMPGQALHARVLGFAHPITGEKLRFEADPPPSFAHLLETMRKYR